MSLIYNPIRLQRTSRPSAVTGGPVRRKLAAACGRFCWETVQGSVEAMKFCLSPIAVAVLALHALPAVAQEARSEEHTSELQSLMRISYAVFCLKKQNKVYYPHY